MPKYIVELYLDGYNTEKEMEDACAEYIYDQLNMAAACVKITRMLNDDQLHEQLDTAHSVVISTREQATIAMDEIRLAAGAPLGRDDTSKMRAVDYVAALRAENVQLKNRALNHENIT